MNSHPTYLFCSSYEIQVNLKPGMTHSYMPRAVIHANLPDHIPGIPVQKNTSSETNNNRISTLHRPNRRQTPTTQNETNPLRPRAGWRRSRRKNMHAELRLLR